MPNNSNPSLFSFSFFLASLIIELDTLQTLEKGQLKNISIKFGSGGPDVAELTFECRSTETL